LALSGDFRETQFADLIEFYEVSRQSVAVTIRLGSAAGEPDGVFYFDRGNLVSGRLRGLEGRDALRLALRLRQGTFTVSVGASPPTGASDEGWNRLVLEELVRIQEEERATRATPAAGGRPPPRAAGATAIGAASLAAPRPEQPPRAKPPPTSREPGPSPESLPPARPAAAAARMDPARTAPRKSVTGIVFLAVGGAALLVLATIVSVLLSSPAREVDRAVERILSPPPVRGVTGDEVVLGMASPFSGANRDLGRAIKAGVETAFAEVNAAGGVHGRRLRLVTVDDGYEPSRTGPAMRRLVESEQVFAVVGNVGTPTAAVSVPYCLEQKVVFLGALSGGELLRRSPPDRYVFNFRPSYAEETAAAVRYLVDGRRIAPARVAVFAQQDGFGDSGWLGASGELARRGVDPARILRVGYRRNTAEVAEAVATLKGRAREVDAVVMVATYKAAAAFIRALRDAGVRVPVTNVSPVDANALGEELSGAGRRYTEGVVVTQVVPPPASSAPALARFRDALEQHGGGERPGFLALEGWIVGHLLAEGILRAGADLDPERLVGGLESIRDLDLGVGTVLSFGPQDHQASHKVWGTMLQPDGSWRQIDLQ
jgi:ABC-type branched-subunit amino acid transport system substrate-binding protein